MDDPTAARWVKSSYSSDNGGDCIEVATLSVEGVVLRDSKRPNGPVLRIPATEWAAFRNSLKSGELSA
ncbi:DUF397 domain-containing protein [Sphaerisporangium sp. NPDC051011]|uniref:DUF397 domain-containing protein n=1 Tax=Sphaerisporangium sp. NPDC051011 TaxID=3155792 RepID=UPI003405C0CE